MKVYGHPLSTCTRKVIATAAEKAAEVELIPLDLFAQEHKQAAHLARHPFGVVPVLDDAGFQLFESRAIIRYLDAKLPGPSLAPTAPRPRARMDQWLSVDQSYVAPHLSTLAQQRLVRKHAGLPIEKAATSGAERALSQAFAVLDRALADQRYLAGEAFSLADISLIPYVVALPMVEAGHVTDGLRHLARWSEDVSSRPSWKRAISAAT